MLRLGSKGEASASRNPRRRTTKGGGSIGSCEDDEDASAAAVAATAAAAAATDASNFSYGVSGFKTQADSTTDSVGGGGCRAVGNGGIPAGEESPMPSPRVSSSLRQEPLGEPSEFCGAGETRMAAAVGREDSGLGSYDGLGAADMAAALWAASTAQSMSQGCWSEGASPITDTTTANANTTGLRHNYFPLLMQSPPGSAPSRGRFFFDSPLDFPPNLLPSHPALDSAEVAHFMEAFRALSFPGAPPTPEEQHPQQQQQQQKQPQASQQTAAAPPAPLHPVSREVFMRVQQQQAQYQQQQQKHENFSNAPSLSMVSNLANNNATSFADLSDCWQSQNNSADSTDQFRGSLSRHNTAHASAPSSQSLHGAEGSQTSRANAAAGASGAVPLSSSVVVANCAGDTTNGSYCFLPAEDNSGSCTSGLLGDMTTQSCPAGSLANQLLLLSASALEMAGSGGGGGGNDPLSPSTPVSEFLRQLEADGDLNADNFMASLMRQSAPGRVARNQNGVGDFQDLGLATEVASSPRGGTSTVAAAAASGNGGGGTAAGAAPSTTSIKNIAASGLINPSGGSAPPSLVWPPSHQLFIDGTEIGDPLQRSSVMPRDRNVSELKGRVVSLAKVQYGSRLLQRLLARGSTEHIELILAETATELPLLMTDPYGNYLCQQLFEVCGKSQRRQILARLAPCTVDIAEDRRGTHSLQSLIGLVSDEQEELLLLEPMLTAADILALSTHPHATHVIQRALTSCGPRVKAMIFEPVILRLNDVARTPHGICVVKRCISAAATEASCAQFKAPLLRKLSAGAIGLIQSPYGNYAVQHALDAFGPELCRPILRQVVDNFVLLSTQKFSSNVVEKSIAVGCEAEICRLVRTATQPAVVKALLGSSYGSFVIQKLLTRMHDSDATKLLHLLIQSNGELTNKRLRSKWERLVSCLADRLGFDSASLFEAAASNDVATAARLVNTLGQQQQQQSQPPQQQQPPSLSVAMLFPPPSSLFDWSASNTTTATNTTGRAVGAAASLVASGSAAPSTAPSTPPPEIRSDSPQAERKSSVRSASSSVASKNAAVSSRATSNSIQLIRRSGGGGSGGGRPRRWRGRRKDSGRLGETSMAHLGSSTPSSQPDSRFDMAAPVQWDI